MTWVLLYLAAGLVVSLFAILMLPLTPAGARFMAFGASRRYAAIAFLVLTWPYFLLRGIASAGRNKIDG